MDCRLILVVLYLIIQLPKSIARKRMNNFKVHSIEWERWRLISNILMALGFVLLLILLVISLIFLLAPQT